jgi:hypothetical protein
VGFNPVSPKKSHRRWEVLTFVISTGKKPEIDFPIVNGKSADRDFMPMP